MSAHSEKEFLSERKKQILKAVVEAHIKNGEPVGSKSLMESAEFSCSSATIRSEMAELEALGYLEQPHTSSGRIPTDLGYRFYVNLLTNDYSMSSAELSEISHAMQIKSAEVDKVLETASKLVSSLTNYTGIAIKPRPSQAHISRFEVMYIGEHNLIIVMLTSVGSVKSKNIFLHDAITRDEAETLTDSLNACFAGLSANQITLPTVMKFENMLGSLSALSNSLIKDIYDVMNEINGGELRYSGLDHLLQYPEYSDVGKFKDLLGALEKQDDILNMVSNSASEGINVCIGSENPVKVMDNSTLVFKTVTKDGKPIGAIGVLGPTRMDYAKVLSALTNISGNISVLMDGTDIPRKSNNLLNEGEHNGG